MGSRKTGAKKVTGAKKATKKKGDSKSKTPRATVAGVSAKVDDLARQIETLSNLVERALVSKSAEIESDDSGVDDGDAEPRAPADDSEFDDDLLRVLSELDRRGRHDGMIPIPEVRDAFLVRGWTRRTFDDRLLQAERNFVVDLKTADDPRRLAKPELSIRERGRGHLQYVVAR